MRVGPFKDRGHYGRKTVAWTLGLLLAVPAILCRVAGAAGEQIENFMGAVWCWAKPCLYRKGPE
jgi:hypothetical protein